MDKLVFISAYPQGEGEKGGEFRRVFAIDRCFQDIPRTYLNIGFGTYCKKNIRKKGLVRIYELNVFLHFFLLYKLLTSASVIYVQTLGSALRILPFYFICHTIISDIHGVLSEEIREYTIFSWGQKWVRFYLYRLVEWIVGKKSKIIITVSHKMTNFMQQIYKATGEFYEIPIFDMSTPSKTVYENKNPYAFLYAGGVHAWQNIDLMISVMEKIAEVQTQAQFFLLGPSTDVFLEKIKGTILESRTIVDCVTPEALYGYYQSASWGFVLREDNWTNRVACPTKLIEYMKYGVIPIVKSEALGDFLDLGYEFISYERITMDTLQERLSKNIREKNMTIIQGLEKKAEKNLVKLRTVIRRLLDER